jgi:acetyltransferase-like isoleucine patch superfamily enzyme
VAFGTYRDFGELIYELKTEIQRRITESLGRPGLAPTWAPGVIRTTRDGRIHLARGRASLSLPSELVALIDDGGLAHEPASEWPAELIALWQTGFVYLCEGERIPAGVQLDCRRLILRNTRIRPPGLISGNGIYLADSSFYSDFGIRGPVAIEGCSFEAHAEIGPRVLLEECGFAPFVRVTAGVDMRQTIVASFSAIFGGGIHAESFPYSKETLSHNGARIGPGAWIGQHVSVLAGARIGQDIVVAAGSVVQSDVGEHALVTGAGRRMPIDQNLRGLTSEQAELLGRDHGAFGVVLPMLGNAVFGREDARTLLIDYPDHGYLKGVAERNSVDFHRGALGAFFAWALPAYRCTVSARVGSTVRFRVELDRPLAPHVSLGPAVELRAVDADCVEELSEREQLILQMLDAPRSAGKLTQQVFSSLLGNSEEDLESEDPSELEFSIDGQLLRLSSLGLIQPPLLPSLGWRHRHLQRRMRRYLDALSDPDHLPQLAEFSEAATAAPTSAPVSASTPMDSSVRDSILRQVRALLPPDKRSFAIPVDTPFLRLGLTSLSLVQFIVGVEEEFRIGEVDLFVNDTVDKLTAAVHEALQAQDGG